MDWLGGTPLESEPGGRWLCRVRRGEGEMSMLLEQWGRRGLTFEELRALPWGH
jgi:hypothetical protein